MLLSLITDYLESIAPLHLQESYDNSGLLVGNPNTQITGAIISLDVTEAVIQEAIDSGANLIISHHPIVFGGLKRFNNDSFVDRCVIKAIKHDIALYAIHTNLDNVHQNGVNQKICDQLGLIRTEILTPKSAETLQIGSGMIGYFNEPKGEIEVLQIIKENMKADCVKHTALLNKPIEKVAVCGGSGSFLLPAAINAGAQLFLTADFKYHQFFDANHEIIIADIGHFETEQFTIDLLHQLITQKFRNFAAHCTKTNTNPVQYF